MPFFSVIVPVYNKDRFVKNTINSILAQSFDDFELIIINDGSTDGSEKMICGFEDSRIRYHKTENQGVSAARNFGIEMSSSDYITFLDADDYWYPDFLSEMKNAIDEFKNHRVFSAAIEIERRGSVVPAEYSIFKHASIMPVNYFSASEKETVICTSCAVFHISVFKEVGMFDPALKSGEDTDLWIKIGMKYPVVFNWKILARYIKTRGSLSSKEASAIDLDKYEKFADNDPRIKKFLDLNRYAVALRHKMAGNNKMFYRVKGRLNPRNLSGRQYFLLLLPAFILRMLEKIR